MITPLVFLAIFNFVFSMAFMTIENYSLFVITGLIFWQFFSNATNQTIQCFIANGGIIKTINIPIHHFPTSAIVTEIVSLLISFIPFTGLMFFFGLELSWHFVLLIPAVFLFAIASYGLGVFLGILNVFLRDISILWTTINPALFYLSPIAFNDSIVPANYLPIIKANPLYHFFKVFRDILYDNTAPDLHSWLVISAIAVVLFAMGQLAIYKLEKGLISNI